jgi:fumarate hydratase class I
MTVIREADVIASVADALQYISYYHTPDFIQAMGRAYAIEQSPAARDAIAQILTNSRMCAEGHRPICQDTGIVVVFVKVGMGVTWDARIDLPAMINEGVRRAYLNPDNKLRASIVADPAFKRANTRDNTPAVIHYEFGPGHTVEITVAAKGGGSENKSMFAMLNPSDSVADWVLDMVPEMGAGWCPPGMLGVGIGGSAEKAMLLAKQSLMEPIDIGDLIKRGPQSKLEELRLEIYRRVNSLGIGAQGLGGLTTVLDVKVLDYPCGLTTGGRHSQLRGDASRAFHLGWHGSRGARTARSRSMAEGAMGRRCRRAAGHAGRTDPRGHRKLAAWRTVAALGKAADGTRRRPQTHLRPARRR